MKDIIFDFGGVLVSFTPEYMTGRYISDEDDIALVSAVLFDRLYWDRLDAGTITDEEVKTAVHARIPERLWEKADSVYDNWMYNLPEIPGMRELLLKLKADGHRLFLLSNISRSFASREDEIPILKLLDGKVYSSVCGYCKPDEKIYRHICEKFSIEPRNAVFVDDREINCAGAEKIGIKGILFDGDAEKLSKLLMNL